MENNNDNTQSFVPLVKGTKVGHYKIISKIGAGGMGEVYLAEDSELKREVALKFMPPHLCADEDYRNRFKREAQAVAKLDHPNIVTIYEVSEFGGRPFFAMQNIEGQSLRDLVKSETLDFDKIIDLAIQICEGLQEAHEAGIVHRDIKPANIIISKRGRARLLDFGLAAVQGTDKLTKTGSTMGTMGYMSPEQIQVKEVDHRSDLFSVGVLLYEMVTAKRPFVGDGEAAILNSILNCNPEPMARYKTDIPDELQRIVSKLLEKDPEFRYQSAAGVISDLKRMVSSEIKTIEVQKPVDWWNRYVVPGAVALLIIMFGYWFIEDYLSESEMNEVAFKTIAVLPFENLGLPEDEYFADGITDEITAKLAGLHALRVTSRTSAMQYKKTEKSAKTIGKELGVDFLLEGTIRWDKSGDIDRVRIIPQLIRVSDDSHVWASTFERAITKIFAVQANIAAIIADTLDIALLDREREAIEEEPTQNLDAYNYYLQGKKSWNDMRHVQQAIDMYEKAVELDTNFYQAYAKLAQLYGYQFINNVCPTDSCIQLAEVAAQKAFQLAKGKLDGHLAMGYFHYYCSRDYERALEQFELVLEKQPNNSEILEAIGYVQRRSGRWEEALANQRRAYELDPRNVGTIDGLCRTLHYMHRINEMKQLNNQALEWNPTNKRLLLWNMMITAYTSDDSTVLENAVSIFVNNAGLSEANYWMEIVDINKRDFKSALKRRSVISGYMLADSNEFYSNKGEIYSYLGEDEMSRTYYDSARIVTEQRLADFPDNTEYRMDLAHAYAGLDRKEEAIREGERAVELMPESKDAMDGKTLKLSLTGVYIKAGEYEKAIDLLEYLLGVPSSLQVYTLKYQPVFDPLRDNPRFQAMIEKYEKKYEGQ